MFQGWLMAEWVDWKYENELLGKKFHNLFNKIFWGGTISDVVAEDLGELVFMMDFVARHWKFWSFLENLEFPRKFDLDIHFENRGQVLGNLHQTGSSKEVKKSLKFHQCQWKLVDITWSPADSWNSIQTLEFWSNFDPFTYKNLQSNPIFLFSLKLLKNSHQSPFNPIKRVCKSFESALNANSFPKGRQRLIYKFKIQIPRTNQVRSC